tara:strand:- start:377 stop:583 length:207 start_codon:yes stop_codon:yes gene_type:complete
MLTTRLLVYISTNHQAVQRRAEAPLTVLRDGKESTLCVRASEVVTDSTQHLVMWCGLILQQATIVSSR